MTPREEHICQEEEKFLIFLGKTYPYIPPTPEHHPNPNPQKILVISDPHSPFENWTVLNRAFEDQAEAGTLIVPGDLGDYYSKSRFRKTRAVPFRDEVRAVFNLMEWMSSHWRDVRIMVGNHDCLDAKTLCLTAELGWTRYTELKIGLHALTLNGSGECEWQEIQSVIRRPHIGDLFITRTRGVSMAVTPNHRVLHRFKRAYKYRTAEDLYTNGKGNRAYIPVSGKNNNQDWMDVSDDELRLIGWLLTDGYIQKRGNNIAYSISQRESKVHLVLEIVQRLKWAHSIYRRQRVITSIASKTLLRPPESEYVVRILSSSVARLVTLVGEKKILPKWLWSLSQRQFDIFLSAMIAGDGSISPHGSLMLYMQGKCRCAEMQALLAKNGYRTSLYPHPNDNYRINISKRRFISIDGGYRIHTMITEHGGDVWCITVPASNFMAMRDGRVFFTGNCRPEKTIGALFDGNTDLLILTEQNLLAYLASYFPNVKIVGTQLDGVDFTLTHIYQHGDILFTHGEISRVQKTAALEYISKYLRNWSKTLSLKPYSIIAQAHNHQDLKTSHGVEKWFMLPTASDPYSIGMEYIYSSRMVGNPPSLGYSVFYQENGITDYNRSHNVVIPYAD